jgi:hypothetical protein
MSQTPGAARERLIELNTLEVKDPPSVLTKPHFFVSPRTAQGLPTQGIALTLIRRTLGAAIGNGGDISGSGGDGGGFAVTIHRAIPTTGGWAVLAPFTTSAVYGEQYVLEDISGAWGLYFQIGGVEEEGRILIGIAEMD